MTTLVTLAGRQIPGSRAIAFGSYHAVMAWRYNKHVKSVTSIAPYLAYSAMLCLAMEAAYLFGKVSIAGARKFAVEYKIPPYSKDIPKPINKLAEGFGGELHDEVARFPRGVSWREFENFLDGEFRRPIGFRYQDALTMAMLYRLSLGPVHGRHVEEGIVREFLQEASRLSDRVRGSKYMYTRHVTELKYSDRYGIKAILGNYYVSAFLLDSQAEALAKKHLADIYQDVVEGSGTVYPYSRELENMLDELQRLGLVRYFVVELSGRTLLVVIDSHTVGFVKKTIGAKGAISEQIIDRLVVAATVHRYYASQNAEHDGKMMAMEYLARAAALASMTPEELLSSDVYSTILRELDITVKTRLLQLLATSPRKAIEKVREIEKKARQLTLDIWLKGEDANNNKEKKRN